MPALSKVRIYKPEELDVNIIRQQAHIKLKMKPYDWQLQVPLCVYCGEDAIVDVGTGSGKTLCFSLPLVLDDTDIVLTISPLTALMVDQVCIHCTTGNIGVLQCTKASSAPVSTVAVCTETILRVGSEKLYGVSNIDILEHEQP